MNIEVLKSMSNSDLDEYGAALGLSMKVAKTHDDKVDYILRRREKVATVHALGLDVEIPVKRANDNRFAEMWQKAENDEEAEAAFIFLIGEEQYKKLVDACTEEDGTVDKIGLSMIVGKVLTSDELKNF